MTYKDQKNFEKSFEDYNSALKIDPNYADGYFNRGVLYKETNNNEKAIEDYTMAIKLNP